MTTKKIILAIVFALLCLILNLPVQTKKRYNFQFQKIEYDWGYLEFKILSTMQNKGDDVYVYGNPYGIALNVYGDYSIKCSMELKEVFLKQRDDTVLYILNDNDLIKDIVEKENRKSLIIKRIISIDKYQTIYGSFKINIICDGKISEIIEEEVVFDTDYVEENDTVLEVFGRL